MSGWCLFELVYMMGLVVIVFSGCLTFCAGVIRKKPFSWEISSCSCFKSGLSTVQDFKLARNPSNGPCFDLMASVHCVANNIQLS